MQKVRGLLRTISEALRGRRENHSPAATNTSPATAPASRSTGAPATPSLGVHSSAPADERDSAALEVATALARISQAMIGEVTLSTALRRLCELTTEVLHCDCSHVWLWNTSEGAYTMAAAHGDAAPQRVPLTPAMLGSVHTRLLREGVVNLGPAPQPTTAQLYATVTDGDEMLALYTAGFNDHARAFTASHARIAHGLAQVAARTIRHLRYVEQLERASQLKSEFAATMSHELRTPLSVIIGYTDLLREGVFGTLTQAQADTLRRIDRRAQELLEVINATLDLGRLEGGRLRLDPSSVALPELFATLEAEAADLQTKPEVALSWQVDSDVPTLHTDEGKLKMILKNLVGNALKFTEHGRVAVAARRRDDGVELTVTDTGIGIAPDAVSLIFEPFQQGGAGIAKQFGGVGLGLHIVRGFAQALGGTVQVESEFGHGSTFRVWLPRECPTPPAPARLQA